jgi:hypothetical protein
MQPATSRPVPCANNRLVDHGEEQLPGIPEIKANFSQNVSITPRLKYSHIRSPILDHLNRPSPKRCNSLIDIDFVNFMDRGSVISMDLLDDESDAEEFR